MFTCLFCVTVITDAVILQCFPDPRMMKSGEEADGEHETCMLGHVQHFAHSDVDDVCVDDLKVQVSRQAAMWLNPCIYALFYRLYFL